MISPRTPHRRRVHLTAAVVAFASVLGAGAVTHASQPPAGTDGSGGSTPSGDPLAPQPLAERTSVSVGISAPILLFAPLYLADRMGEFDKENIDVSIEVVPPTELPLLADQGELDAVITAYNAGLMNFISSGGGVRAVFPMENEYEDPSEAGIWMRKDVIGDDGFQPADVADVPIAFPAGISAGGLAEFWYQTLQPGDFAAEDVTAQVLAVPDIVAGLQSGAVPAGILTPPFTAEVRDSGCCEFVGGNPVHPYVWVFFGNDLLSENPDVGMAFLRALGRTTETYLSDNFIEDEEIVATLAEALEQPVEAVANTPATSFDLTNTDPQGALDELFGFWLSRDDIVEFTEPLAVDEVHELSFFEALFPDIPVQ